jgi:hypothetical protein
MKKRIGTLAARLAMAVFVLAALAQCGENPFYPFTAGGGNAGGNWVAEYEIGETGSGGGKIFYISSGGFTMTNNGQTCHYLEATPADITGTFAWSSGGVYDTTNITGTETALGTGRKNTALILATDVAAPAALACKNYNSGGKNDWFLPSRAELYELYGNRSVIGNLTTTSGSFYWTSSQYTTTTGGYVNFFNGNQGSGPKTNTRNVRAVRAF